MNNFVARDLVSLIGNAAWSGRVHKIRAALAAGPQSGRLAGQKFAAECALEKARRGLPLVPAERALVELATRIPTLYDRLNAGGQARLRGALDEALTGEATLMPVLHLLHTAKLQQERGFEVEFSGLEDEAPFDLLIRRAGTEAEIACGTLSAEEGHAVHKRLWTRLIDQIDPDLQTWLAAHPGRYLLKMTLPKGLREEAKDLPALHRRIKSLLASQNRADYDEAAMLRLDPLLLAGAQAADRAEGVMGRLRREFGPEAHFAITGTGENLFVMTARGAAENEVAATLRRRLAALAPARLTGARPGILAMFLDDTDQAEWQILRENLLLEGEARQFLTYPEARPVIAVTCASRFELFGAGCPEGDLRFRNPMHPSAKCPGLAPAVLSTV